MQPQIFSWCHSHAEFLYLTDRSFRRLGLRLKGNLQDSLLVVNTVVSSGFYTLNQSIDSKDEWRVLHLQWFYDYLMKVAYIKTVVVFTHFWACVCALCFWNLWLNPKPVALSMAVSDFSSSMDPDIGWSHGKSINFSDWCSIRMLVEGR